MDERIHQQLKAIMHRDSEQVLFGYLLTYSKPPDGYKIINETSGGFTVVDCEKKCAVCSFSFHGALRYRDKAREAGLCA